MSAALALTGVGVERPGLERPEALLEGRPLARDPAAFDPQARLGRKGLLGKDRATRLALCAARAALLDAGLPDSAARQLEPDAFGVSVASNLGNLDTVCRVADTIHAAGVAQTSVLDLPNASSNVVAAALAIRFGCRAVNLMLCSGAGAGGDALYLAACAIRAGRARRMLVVGVEPDSEPAARLLRQSAGGVAHEEPCIVDGAAAVVLEERAAARARGAKADTLLAGFGRGADAATARDALPPGTNPGLWLGSSPDGGAGAWAFDWRGRAPRLLDLDLVLGECYGALAVFQCVAAALFLRGGTGRSVVAISGGRWGDPAHSLLLCADGA